MNDVIDLNFYLCSAISITLKWISLIYQKYSIRITKCLYFKSFFRSYPLGTNMHYSTVWHRKITGAWLSILYEASNAFSFNVPT